MCQNLLLFSDDEFFSKKFFHEKLSNLDFEFGKNENEREAYILSLFIKKFNQISILENEK